MKGIIFTEFLEMVEDKFGYEAVDHIITESKDPEDGAYTAVNTYDHQQLVNLVLALHKKSGIPLRDLLMTYGRHLFGQLARSYEHFLEGVTDPFDLLIDIELLIHTQVRKLYPEANPPRFNGERIDEDTMRLTYRSHRSMGDVAEGLMHGCADYFDERFEIEQTEISEDGQTVQFLIKKVRA